MKNSRQLERHFKGVANHWRIDILLLVSKKDSITLELVAEELGGNLKTISVHVKKLVAAGLLNKKYRGREVLHSLSPYGCKFIEFFKTF